MSPADRAEASRSDLPIASDTIPALLRLSVDIHGAATAVVDGAETLSWTELADEVRNFSAALIASGVGAGDRIAIWAPNSARWITAALGIFGAGATLVPINTRFKGLEARDIIDRSAATTLVTVTDFLDGDFLALLDAAGPRPAALRTRVVMDGPVNGDALSWEDFLAGAGSDDHDEADRRVGEIGPDDVSDILFTSGTTGAPKGVVQTHARTLRVATDWVDMTGLCSDDRYLMVNPYFHMFGLKAGILASVAAGSTMYPQPTFDADRVLSRVAAELITVLPGPPTLYQSLLDHPGRNDEAISSLRIAVTGASDIPVELIRRIADEFPFERIITGYGLTEAGTATATGPADDPEIIATTVGRPRPGFQLRIGDGSGGEVPRGDTGEILLRGASIMSHYLDDPEATAAALGSDGWLRTGDLGYIDDSGCLRIVGRSKEMFIVGGFNAYPAEIENMLLEHPGIAQVAVIGIPDERLGEVGMAFVVPRRAQPDADDGGTASLHEALDEAGSDGTGVHEAGIIAWSRDRMANYKAPRRVEIVDQLPVNATGKVVKDQLRTRVT